jgi:hypothetical protein
VGCHSILQGWQETPSIGIFMMNMELFYTNDIQVILIFYIIFISITIYDRFIVKEQLYFI